MYVIQTIRQTSGPSALWGEIYPAMRKVVFNYDTKKKELMLRYYLDREPRKADYKSARVITNKLSLNFHSDKYLKHIKEECIYSDAPGNKLDVLNGSILYARRRA